MAPRRKGTLDLQENIETGKQMPLDARQLVRSKEEMLTEGSFDYGYKGLFTAERTEGKLWMLMDHQNPTQEASWKVIGPYDDSALDARVTALEQGGGSEAKVLVAEYNVTTAQEIMDYMDSANEPYAPIVIKRDTNYHTVETMFKRNEETVILRSIGTINGEYYMFTYAITGNVWAISTDYGFQRKLESGTNIKTVGGQSLLGSGDIPVSGSQVQSNWEETDTASAAYIQNKPTIPPAYDDTAIQAALAGKADASSLANVATSGSYNDLGDKPTIPEAYDDSALAARIAAVETTLPNKANTADLANVATSGSYNDLGDKPTIPAAYDDTALAGRVSALEAKTETQADWNETDTDSAAYIANKPTIPEAYDDTALAGRVTAVETALPGKADSSSLATVATSGSYNDLADQPTIPEAYDDTALSTRVTALEGRIDADTQADWNETDTTSPAFIQNKPTIPTPITITIDAAMDAASENPVQNKVVLAAIGDAVDVVDTAVQGLDTRVTTLETDKVTVTTAAIPGGGGGEEVTVSVQEAGDQTGEKVLGVRYFTDDQGAVSGDPTLIVGNQNFALNTQADWNETDTTSAAYIQNKPTIPTTPNLDDVLAKGNSSIRSANVSSLIANSGGSSVTTNVAGGTVTTTNRKDSPNIKTGIYSADTIRLSSGNLLEPTTELEITSSGNVSMSNSMKTGFRNALGIVVDFALDSASQNPVENRVVNQAIEAKQDTLTAGDGIVIDSNNTISALGNYIVDKPEGGDSQLGNVVQVGTLQDVSGEVGIFEFFYRTSALPNNTTKEYTLLPLLQDYNIVDFLDGTGVTSNGIFIGNGRTDGTNYLIIQQFSKNRKAVILRTYQDYSAQTALLKIKFLGTKTTA